MKFLLNRRKQCIDCNKYKLYRNFASKRTDCKDCQSSKNSIRKYGIDNNQILSLLESQNGQCAICLKKIENRTDANVDHCHATGAVRGILCSNCNTAVGLLSDNWKSFERGMNYILKFKTRLLLYDDLI